MYAKESNTGNGRKGSSRGFTLGNPKAILEPGSQVSSQVVKILSDQADVFIGNGEIVIFLDLELNGDEGKCQVLQQSVG